MSANLENPTVTAGLTQFPRRTALKSVATTGQLHTSPMLVTLCSKSFNLPHYVNRELPDVQVGFRKGRGTRG